MNNLKNKINELAELIKAHKKEIRSKSMASYTEWNNLFSLKEEFRAHLIIHALNKRKCLTKDNIFNRAYLQLEIERFGIEKKNSKTMPFGLAQIAQKYLFGEEK